MNQLKSIVAADDHKLFLEGLKSLFEFYPDFELRGLATNGDDLLVLVRLYRPDIILLDLSMPGATTEEILKQVKSTYAHSKVIALTMHLEAEMARKYFSLGLDGYVLKDDAFDTLQDAITTVIAGEEYVAPALFQAIKAESDQKTAKPLLSERELGVLKLAASGQSNKQMARILDITERTVRFHLENCCEKLNANGRSHAVAKALQYAYITL